jgi:cell wall-associated NlpC family hydrolase
MYAWAAAGVSLPHSSSLQFSSGTKVSVSALQPGDLVFYGAPIHHVALYVGGGQVIHAPQTGDVVRYASVDMMPIAGAVRP